MSENPQDAYPNPDKYEKCIICKQKTMYTRKTNINRHQHYIEGMGPTCRSCYYGMHNISTTYNINIDNMYEHFLQ